MGDMGDRGLFYPKIWEEGFLLIPSPRRVGRCLATIRGVLKALQKIMIIGVDAAVLGVMDDRFKVGVYQFALNLLENLAKYDRENKYLLYSFDKIPQNIFKKFGSNFVNIVLRPKRGWLNIRLSAQFIFHKHDFFLGLSQALPFYHPMKSIVYVHDLAFELYPEFYKGSYKRLSRQTKFAVKNCDQIVAVSKATKNDLVKIYNVDPNRIFVIYHGVEDRFKPQAIKNKEKVPYFLFLGSHKPGKNIPNIIKAFRLFLKEIKKPFNLKLAGSDYWLNWKTHEDEEIKILDYIPEEKLPQLYRQAFAFVSPSYYEGFGMPLLEAIASGVAVITSHRGSIPEVVGEAAIMVEPHDIDGLKDAMFSLANDNKLREKLIKKGLIQAQKFSWQKSAKQLLDLMNKI